VYPFCDALEVTVESNGTLTLSDAGGVGVATAMKRWGQLYTEAGGLIEGGEFGLLQYRAIHLIDDIRYSLWQERVC